MYAVNHHPSKGVLMLPVQYTTLYSFCIEDHWLRVFKNKVLRRLFDPRAEEATLYWRKLNSGEHHYLNHLPNTIMTVLQMRVKWTRYVACMGVVRIAYKYIVW